MHDFDDGEWEHSPEPRPIWGCKHCDFTMPMDPDDIEGERVEQLYAKFIRRQPSETTMKTKEQTPEIRPTISPRAYSLKGQLSQLVEAANYDHDRACWIELGESSEKLEGAIVILKGDATVRSFEQWATNEGHFTPGNLQSFTSQALDYRLPDLNGKPGFYVSPPMVCPCENRKCKAVGREVGCKEHPGAGLRVVVFGDQLSTFCNECGRQILRAPMEARSVHPGCANGAKKRNDIN